MNEEIQLQAAARLTKQGDLKAFEKLYYLTCRYAYFHAVSISQDENEAWDLLRETYIIVYQNIQMLREEKYIKSWISRILFRLGYKRMKEKSGELTEEEEICDEDQGSPEKETCESKEVISIVWEVIDNLSCFQKAVLIAYYFDEKSIEVIAEEAVCSPKIVESRLNSARKAMKEAVERKESRTGGKLSAVTARIIMQTLQHMFIQLPVSEAKAENTLKLVEKHVGSREAEAAPKEAVHGERTDDEKVRPFLLGKVRKMIAVMIAAILMALAGFWGTVAALNHRKPDIPVAAKMETKEEMAKEEETAKETEKRTEESEITEDIEIAESVEAEREQEDAEQKLQQIVPGFGIVRPQTEQAEAERELQKSEQEEKPYWVNTADGWEYFDSRGKDNSFAEIYRKFVNETLVKQYGQFNSFHIEYGYGGTEMGFRCLPADVDSGIISLHMEDMNCDGTPELIAFTASPSQEGGTDIDFHMYRLNGGKVSSAGEGRLCTDLFRLDSQEFEIFIKDFGSRKVIGASSKRVAMVWADGLTYEINLYQMKQDGSGVEKLLSREDSGSDWYDLEECIHDIRQQGFEVTADGWEKDQKEQFSISPNEPECSRLITGRISLNVPVIEFYDLGPKEGEEDIRKVVGDIIVN